MISDPVFAFASLSGSVQEYEMSFEIEAVTEELEALHQQKTRLLEKARLIEETHPERSERYKQWADFVDDEIERWTNCLALLKESK